MKTVILIPSVNNAAYFTLDTVKSHALYHVQASDYDKFLVVPEKQADDYYNASILYGVTVLPCNGETHTDMILNAAELKSKYTNVLIMPDSTQLFRRIHPGSALTSRLTPEELDVMVFEMIQAISQKDKCVTSSVIERSKIGNYFNDTHKNFIPSECAMFRKKLIKKADWLVAPDSRQALYMTLRLLYKGFSNEVLGNYAADVPLKEEFNTTSETALKLHTEFPEVVSIRHATRNEDGAKGFNMRVSMGGAFKKYRRDHGL